MTDEELQEAREYTTCQEYDCPSEDIIKGLLAHIDEQACQIATLKAICIKERFWLIWKGGECASVERATAKAEHQLATEYPDIVWEDKK